MLKFFSMVVIRTYRERATGLAAIIFATTIARLQIQQLVFSSLKIRPSRHPSAQNATPKHNPSGPEKSPSGPCKSLVSRIKQLVSREPCRRTVQRDGGTSALTQIGLLVLSQDYNPTCCLQRTRAGHGGVVIRFSLTFHPQSPASLLNCTTVG
jgi:hypothetical protein